MKSLYAFISDEPGEGIMTLETPNGNFPFVTGDMDIATALIPYANAAVAKDKKRISLIKFDRVEVLETFAHEVVH